MLLIALVGPAILKGEEAKPAEVPVVKTPPEVRFDADVANLQKKYAQDVAAARTRMLADLDKDVKDAMGRKDVAAVEQLLAAKARNKGDTPPPVVVDAGTIPVVIQGVFYVGSQSHKIVDGTAKIQKNCLLPQSAGINLQNEDFDKLFGDPDNGHPKTMVVDVLLFGHPFRITGRGMGLQSLHLEARASAKVTSPLDAIKP